MARPSLIWPLTLLVTFVALVAMLIFGVLPQPVTAQSCEAYPVGDPRRAACASTATARSQTQTAQVYPSNTATTQAVAQPPAATATSTLTPTLGLSPTVTVATTPTLAVTRTPTATRQPQGSPSPTATSTLVGLETIICAPGTNATISGQGDPGRALLVFFDERPVGGSLVRPDGFYSLLLRVGAERPGLYLVEIRDRSTLAVVRSLACEVPGATATPTSVLIP